MLSYNLPLRPQEMTVTQLDKFRDYVLNKMTPQEEDKFYKELAEDADKRLQKRKRIETPLLDEEEMEIMKKSKIYEDDEETTTPVLNEEEMEIMKQSKVFEEDTNEKKNLEKKEKEMDVFKEANIDADYDDFLKELDYEGEGGKRRTRKGGRRLRRKTKKHNKKSKTHKKRNMHKKRRTHRKR